ncbi:UTRA domain-containing protein [Pseudonocardia sp. Ae717_Ps2]|uniref:UTRA domain-containing protein n=1 Tax=Pseudonocardia sp. Ae717_Ps2 TaxID=1885573 RepID=UPI00350EB35B
MPRGGAPPGDDSKIETVEASYDVANHEVAQRLGIGRGDRVVHRVRRYYKGRHIVLLHDQWLPGEVGARIHSETGYDPADKDAHERTDLYSFMREAGYQPAQTTERVSTRMPDPDERDVMSIPPGVPVLITLRTTRDASQIELETSNLRSNW